MEKKHVPFGDYDEDAMQADTYMTPQECGWKNCDTKVKMRRYHFCSHVRSHALNYAPPKDGGKCLYCGDTFAMSQGMRKHVKASHPGGLEEMAANKAEDHAAKKDAEAAVQESKVAEWENVAAELEEDAMEQDESVKSENYKTAGSWLLKANHTKNGARRLRTEAQDSRDEAQCFLIVAKEEKDAAQGKNKVAKKEDVAAKMAKRAARKQESVENKLKGKVVSEQTATAQCASTPSKAPRPFNISRGLKPATKSSPDKSLREQYKESSALGFTTEEESSTSSDSDDEADASPTADTNTPKSTVASRNPLPPGFRSTQSISSPASKLKWPPALLAAVQGLDNLINPLLKEEVAADASSHTALLAATGDKVGAEVANTVEAAAQLVRQLAAVNTGRYNALGELQNGVVEIAKKRESQLEALEREVALLKQQMK